MKDFSIFSFLLIRFILFIKQFSSLFPIELFDLFIKVGLKKNYNHKENIKLLFAFFSHQFNDRVTLFNDI